MTVVEVRVREDELILKFSFVPSLFSRSVLSNTLILIGLGSY